FLPLLIQDLGVTDRGEVALWTGLAIGTSGMAMALASPVWGLLADRFGRKAMLVRAIASGSILLGLQAAVTSVWQLAIVRILQGAFTGTQTAAAMLLAGIVPKERTGFALGMLNTAVQVGNLAGPVLGGIAVASIGLRGSFVIGALVLGVCTVITIVWTDDVAVAPTSSGTGVRNVARDVFTPFAWPGLRGVLVIGTMVQVAWAGTIALIAIYVQDLARPSWLSLELTIGLSLALTALAAAIAMPILGAWADRHDPRALLVVSLVVVSLSLVPQALIPDAVVFLALRLVLGAGAAGTTSAIAVLTRAGAPVGGEGRAFGALAAAQNLGWGIGPIVGASFAAIVGIPALYLAAAVITLALVPAALTRSWFATPERMRAEPLPIVTTAPAED
ncbi:MAG TPA: MFS transporter, partial [Candidatus Limnocylindria bacterium]|nr:MFS transporter [Candidatus Limnocylindria bacterium]